MRLFVSHVIFDKLGLRHSLHADGVQNVLAALPGYRNAHKTLSILLGLLGGGGGGGGEVPLHR